MNHYSLILTPLRRGFHLLCHKLSPLLSIWVVINGYAMFVLSLIFTLKESGLRNPVIKEELCRQPYEKPVRTRCRPKIKLTTTTACRLLPNHWAITSLPKSLKVLLENLLRWQDGNSVTEEDIHTLAGSLELPMLTVKMPPPGKGADAGLTGVPAVVNLAAIAKRLNASAAILQRLIRSHRSTWSLTTR
ncbi:hypothetical protein ACNKHP_01400 [Shigella boydii]